MSDHVLLSMCIPLQPLSVQKQIMEHAAIGREADRSVINGI